MSPVRSGIALALTVALFYALCTVAWFAAPEQFLHFLNSLFHGLDFRPMYRPQPFDWLSFGLTFGMWILWAFCAGAFYTFVARRLAR